MRRLATLALVPLLLAAAVGIAIAASPGPEAELAVGKGKVVKYKGSWSFAQSADEKFELRASGFKAGRRAVRAQGSFDASGDRCPTAMGAADTRARDKLKRPGKRTWRSKGNTNGTGNYRLEVKTGKKVQRLRMRGTGPACNTDGFYEVAGKFTGPKGGTALGKRFAGTLKGNEDPPNPVNVKIKAKRVN